MEIFVIVKMRIILQRKNMPLKMAYRCNFSKANYIDGYGCKLSHAGFTGVQKLVLICEGKKRCGLINKGDKIHMALYQSTRGKSQRTKVNLSFHDSSKALKL